MCTVSFLVVVFGRDRKHSGLAAQAGAPAAGESMNINIFNCVPRAGALALQNGKLDLCSLNLENVPSADMEASGCKDARDGGNPQHLRTMSKFNQNTMFLF